MKELTLYYFNEDTELLRTWEIISMKIVGVSFKSTVVDNKIIKKPFILNNESNEVFLIDDESYILNFIIYSILMK